MRSSVIKKLEKKLISREYDPRTKMVLVMCITTLAVFFRDVFWMFGVLALAFGVSLYFKSETFSVMWKLRKFIWIFIGMIFIQSIFTAGGSDLITLGNITLLTTMGLYNGISILLRMMIIVVSATVLATSNSRDIVQGLYQWKIPYELAFMVSVAIRFIPMLREEALDMVTAIQLRGVDLEQVPLGKRIRIYSYLLLPMIASVLGKAKELAIAVEMRGFRASSNRTSFRTLNLRVNDYAIMGFSVFFTIISLYFYFGKFNS